MSASLPLNVVELTNVIYDWMPDGAQVSVGLDGETRHLTGADLARYLFDRAEEYRRGSTAPECGEDVPLFGVPYGEQFESCRKPRGHDGFHDPSDPSYFATLDAERAVNRAVAEAAREVDTAQEPLNGPTDWGSDNRETVVVNAGDYDRLMDAVDALRLALAALGEPLPFTHPRLGVAAVREEFDPHLLEEPLP